MNISYLIILCIGLQSGMSSGLRCWKCENARSPSECIIKGQSQLCRANEKACQTEVRYSNGWGRRANIRTSCKEAHACGNNFKQNSRPAWSPTQCNGGTDNSVCRCCCNRFHCNRQTLLCQPRVCDAISAPENGEVNCTGTGSSEVGKAACVFRCNEGYNLTGSRTTACINTPQGPKWSHDVPTCEGVCDPISAPANGTVNCTGSNVVDRTICDFRCNEGFKLLGFENSSCISTSTGPRWSNKVPTCEDTKDDEEIPQETTAIPIEPTDSDLTTAATSAATEPPPSLAQETTAIPVEPTDSDLTTAVTTAVTEPTPSLPPVCKNIGVLPNGEISCTHADNRVGTICSFRCNGEYVLIPSNRTEATCVINSDEEAEWSNKKPCCSTQCPPIAKKDVILVIDSSQSIGPLGWQHLRDFLNELVGKFNVSYDGVRVAAVSFSHKVDEDSQFYLGDYNDTNNVIAQIRKLKRLDSTTYIGNALRHTQRNILPKNNRDDVSDLIFAVTDGNSHDEFSGVAKELRDSGVQIVALGVFRNNEKRNETITQLEQLTGDRESVFDVRNFFDVTEAKLLTDIVEKMCELSCNE